MSVASHLQALADKRADIKAEIAAEIARPMPDFERVHALKKANLKFKEEMQTCFEKMRKEDAATS